MSLHGKYVGAIQKVFIDMAVIIGNTFDQFKLSDHLLNRPGRPGYPAAQNKGGAAKGGAGCMPHRCAANSNILTVLSRIPVVENGVAAGIIVTGVRISHQNL